MHLMHRQLEPLSMSPRHERPDGRDLQSPPRQRSPQRLLILSEYRDVHIRVRPGHLAEHEVERPPTRDCPGSLERPKGPGDLVNLSRRFGKRHDVAIDGTGGGPTVPSSVAEDPATYLRMSRSMPGPPSTEASVR